MYDLLGNLKPSSVAIILATEEELPTDVAVQAYQQLVAYCGPHGAKKMVENARKLPIGSIFAGIDEEKKMT